MAHYLIQAAYTPEAWASLLKNPQDRTQVLKPVLDKLGGRFVDAYFAFGEYDIIGVVEAPGNIEAAALSLAVAAGGACKAFKTTPLMTVADGLEAMRRAAAIGYAPPAGAVAGV